MVSRGKQILNSPFGCLTDRLTETSLGTEKDNKSQKIPNTTSHDAIK